MKCGFLPVFRGADERLPHQNNPIEEIVYFS